MSALRPEPPAFAERRQFLTFRLGGRTRALDSTRIVRVAEIHHVTPLPSDLRCNLGLVIHRGVVAGLMDLELLEEQSVAPRADSPGNSPGDPPAAPRHGRQKAHERPLRGVPKRPFYCIFARFPGGVAGFAIDELLELKSVAFSENTPDPPTDPTEAGSFPFEIVDLDTLQIFQ